MNNRHLEQPGFSVDPLFEQALGTGEVLVLAFPIRAGMRPATEPNDTPESEEALFDPRRN